jgi:hypothetical protein
MLFIMPMPPTTNEMAATQPSKLRNDSVVEACTSMIRSWVSSENPGWLGSVPCLAARRLLTWAITLGTCSLSVGET